MDKLKLAFGRQTFPDNVQAVWGARLIWPDDLVWDRQDIGFHDNDAKTELIAWLNGVPAGKGALQKMRDNLRDPSSVGFTGQGDTNEAVIYEDEHGKIIGSPQGSYGYIYVCAWMFKHVPAEVDDAA
jgi:hypothetical protein